MTLDEIKTMIASPAYDFLRTDEHLKNRVMLLTLGGSHAYGTEVDTSDVDLRGCALNSPSDILGFTNFEQLVDKETDTTIFAFNKLIRLLSNCNPNVIEMLGGKPEYYLMVSPLGQEMLKNRKMFLSQRAAYTFGGYAFSQLRRLENAIARDKLAQPQKEVHIKNSIDKVIKHFHNEDRTPVGYSLSIMDAVNEDLEKETYITMSLQDYPVRNLKALCNDISNVLRDYAEDLHGRNRKKDDAHLNKHAMHLIRLYLMCIDILEKEEIITYREADHDLLMDIRLGRYRLPDGTFAPAFFDILNDFSKELDYAKAHTALPKAPDMKRIEEFVMDVNRKSL